MTTADWALLKYFRPDSTTDNLGDPDRLSKLLMFRAEAFRRRVGAPFQVHCGTGGKHSGQTHGQGLALDGHVKGVDLLDIYLAAEREGFTGIGVYNWGIHVDVRIGDPARWCRIGGKYFPLDAENFDFLRKKYNVWAM